MNTIHECNQPSKLGMHIQNLPHDLREFVQKSKKYQVLRPTGAILFSGNKELIRLPTLEDIVKDAYPAPG